MLIIAVILLQLFLLIAKLTLFPQKFLLDITPTMSDRDEEGEGGGKERGKERSKFEVMKSLKGMAHIIFWDECVTYCFYTSRRFYFSFQ